MKLSIIASIENPVISLCISFTKEITGSSAFKNIFNIASHGVESAGGKKKLKEL